MPWIEVFLKITPESAEAVGQVLIEGGSLGVWERDSDTVSAYFPGGTTTEQLQVILEEVKSWGAVDAPAVSKIPDQDWVARWKVSLTPLRVTPRLVVVPSWQSYEARDGEHVVVLDPGMAFGTGHHETTRMCLELLDERLKSGNAEAVLDLGTGSGILAIAAARLGARRVVASDIDPEAIAAAAENVRRNALGAVIAVVNGDDAWGLGPYDLVLANLTAEDLAGLVPRIAEVLAEDGHAVLSGILIERESMVADAIIRAAVSVAERRNQGEWAALRVTHQVS